MTVHTRSLVRRHIAGPYTAVAVLNYYDEKLFDWAAYLGVGDDEYIAACGEKLDHVAARMLFGEIEEGKYRL